MNNSSTTIRDVARLAQVSITTASHALSGVGRVSAQTRTRVTAAARQLNYVPNASARSLRRARTDVIGLYLHPHATHLTFHHDMVIAGFNAAVEHDYDVMLLGPRQLTPARLRSRVDGLIISDPFYDHEPTRAVLASGLPVVAVGQTDPSMPAPAGIIQANHDDGIRALLEDMRLGGVRRPALLMSSAEYPSFFAKMVTSAYRQWCESHGIQPLVEPLTIDAPVPDLERVVDTVLAASPRVDGIVAGRGDIMAHVINYLPRHGRAAGRDMALASLVDEPVLAHLRPAISAVNLNPAVYYRLAVDMMARILAGEPVSEEVTHRVDVRLRGSSRLAIPGT